MYDRITLEDDVQVVKLEHMTVDSACSMTEYARILSTHIDTTEPFVLIGLSLGGMIAVEMNNYIKPEGIILISSVCNASQLPGRYRIMRYLPFHKCIGKNSMSLAAKLFPVLSELDSSGNVLYTNMIADHDPKTMRTHIGFIAHWKQDTNCSGKIYQIHGEKDPVLPMRKIEGVDHVIPGGKHKLLITHSEEISALLNMIIKKAAAKSNGS